MVIDTRISSDVEYEEPDTVLYDEEPDFSPLQHLVERESIIEGELIAMHDKTFEFEFNDLGPANPSGFLFDGSDYDESAHLVRFRYTFYGVSNFRIKERLKFKFTSFEDSSTKTYRKIRFESDEGKAECSFHYHHAQGPLL